jgi:hypothetical protein
MKNRRFVLATTAPGIVTGAAVLRVAVELRR